MEHLLEKVLVDVYLWRHIELEVLPEVFDEISLGPELADKLRSHYSSLLGALERLLHLAVLQGRHIDGFY